MRLKINGQALDALKRLHKRIAALNTFSGNMDGTFASQLLIGVDRHLSADQLTSIAADATSPKVRKKQIRDRLEKLADQIDEDALEKLERRIKKIETKTETRGDIGGKTAEIS